MSSFASSKIFLPSIPLFFISDNQIFIAGKVTFLILLTSSWVSKIISLLFFIAASLPVDSALSHISPIFASYVQAGVIVNNCFKILLGNASDGWGDESDGWGDNFDDDEPIRGTRTA